MGTRNETALVRSETPVRMSATSASDPSSMVRTRNIADLAGAATIFRVGMGSPWVGGCAVLPTLTLRYRPAAVGHNPRKSSTISAALVSRHAPKPVPAHRFSPSASPADAARSGAVM